MEDAGRGLGEQKGTFLDFGSLAVVWILRALRRKPKRRATELSREQVEVRETGRAPGKGGPVATRDGTGAAREPWEVDDNDHWPGTSFMSIATRRGSREEQILVEFKLPNQIDSPSSRLSEDFNDLEEGERDEESSIDNKESLVTMLLMSALTPIFYSVVVAVLLAMYTVFVGLQQVAFIVGWAGVEGREHGTFLITATCLNLVVYLAITKSFTGSRHRLTRLETASYFWVLFPIGLPSMAASLSLLVLGFVSDTAGDRGLQFRVMGMAFQTLSLAAVTAFWVLQVKDYVYVNMTLK